MSFHFGGRVVRNGLVFHLDTANRKSYPGTGTVWNDLTINNNNGILINGPTFDSANGGSLVFDGINEYATFQNSDVLNPGDGSFTIICWANSDWVGGTDQWDLWVTKRLSIAGTSVGYYLGSNVNRVRFMASSDVGRSDTPFIPFTPNVWNMYNGVLDRTSNLQTVILNNYQSTASVAMSGGIYNTNAPLIIGGDLINNSFYVKGKQSVVMIYNRALSSQEILQNYNTLKYRYI